MARIGRGVPTEWDAVLSPAEATERAARLMREQQPHGHLLIAFTLRVATNTDIMFMSDIAAMAKHYGFTVAPWTRCCEEFGVLHFTRRSP